MICVGTPPQVHKEKKIWQWDREQLFHYQNNHFLLISIEKNFDLILLSLLLTWCEICARQSAKQLYPLPHLVISTPQTVGAVNVSSYT